MNLNETIIELQKKIKIYQEAFEKERKELTSIRTQKATEAKKTLAHYESMLPILDAVIKEKIEVSANLDKKIKDKESRYNAQREDLQKKYDEIAIHLFEEYEKKRKALEADRAIVLAEKQSLSKESEDLVVRCKAFNTSSLSALDNISKKNQEITNSIVDLEKSRVLFETNKKEVEAGLKKETEELRAKVVEWKIKENQLVKREEFIKSKEAEIDAIKDKENKLYQVGLMFDARESTLNNREAEINERAVRVAALDKKVNLRVHECDLREQKLNVREQNLKEIEANVKI